MIKVTQAILAKVLTERPVLADLIELELGTREAERVGALLKEKPPLEAMRFIERLNAEACGKYKTNLRVARRTLDNWDTTLLALAALATLFILIALILTVFKIFIVTLVFEILAIATGGVSAFLTWRSRRLRTEIDHTANIQDEHCQDAAQLSTISGALTGTSIDEAQKIIQRLLFAEEL